MAEKFPVVKDDSETKDKHTFPFGALTVKGCNQMQSLGKHLRIRLIRTLNIHIWFRVITIVMFHIHTKDGRRASKAIEVKPGKHGIRTHVCIYTISIHCLYELLLSVE